MKRMHSYSLFQFLIIFFFSNNKKIFRIGCGVMTFSSLIGGRIGGKGSGRRTKTADRNSEKECKRVWWEDRREE